MTSPRVTLCDDASAALLAHLAETFPTHAVCVISDDTVARLHATRIHDMIRRENARASLLTFPHGEWSKSREQWAWLSDAMIEDRFGRDTVVVAIGGGVTGDLAGFVAATYMRGVPIVQVPTSLVAMVDAAIGGKTAIDAPGGKNLIGAFHPPSAVLVDPTFLHTLSTAQMREGLVEALKHGAIADAAYFDWIVAHAHSLAHAGARMSDDDLRHLVKRSIEIKTDVVEEDPFERGRRAILNFGHTIAHAIEQVSGYTVGHGVAVAHGMLAESRIGEALGRTEQGTALRIGDALRALGIDRLPALDPDALARAAATDKKNRAGAIRMTLIRSIGEVARAADDGWTHAVDPDELVRYTSTGSQ